MVAAETIAVVRNIESTQNITAKLNLQWSSGSTQISGNPIASAIRSQAAAGRTRGAWIEIPDLNHHGHKPPAVGWLCQAGSGAICLWALSGTRRTVFTVSSTASTAKGFDSVAAS